MTLPLRFSTSFQPFPAVAAATTAALALLIAAPAGLRAGPVVDDETAPRSKNVIERRTEEKTLLDEFQIDTSYVGKGDFKDGQFGGSSGLPRRSYGDQDEFHITAEYSHRFQLQERIYLRLGVDYERFAFGKSFAPVPTTLQSLTGVVALEYVVQNRPAYFISSKPGIYYSNWDNVGTGNFDAPTVVAGVAPLWHNAYLIFGARFSLLAKYPAFPVLGFKWDITKDLHIDAIPPEPRIVYDISDRWEVFVGAEFLGEAYKRDRNPNARPQDQRFNEGIVDYSEYRVGGGFSYNISKSIGFDVSGGWVPRRTFDYYRGDDGGKRFKVEGAPYAKVSFSAQF